MLTIVKPVPEPFDHEVTHPSVEIFDPPMCCPTGLCGPTIDPVLLDVNEMILTLQGEGIGVARYQMTSHPQAFIGNGEVFRLVREQQMAALPITVVRGRILKTGAYPSLDEVRAALNGGSNG
jgi:hypothetical protein